MKHIVISIIAAVVAFVMFNTNSNSQVNYLQCADCIYQDGQYILEYYADVNNPMDSFKEYHMDGVTAMQYISDIDYFECHEDITIEEFCATISQKYMFSGDSVVLR